jgi:hypothetical protein
MSKRKRGCLHSCADRAAPRSPPSCAPPAGNSTRCALSWRPSCSRAISGMQIGVGTGPQLKRETSLWREFGWIPTDLCDLSKG